MLNSKAYVYNILNTALTGQATVVYMYPNDFNALPVVTYQETNNMNADFYDDSPFSDEISVQIDVWANSSTTALAQTVDAAMKSNLFARDFAGDMPEPDAKIFHKVLKYRRKLTADDLDNA